MSQLRTLTDINTSQPSPHCSTNFSLSSSSVLLKELWAEILTDTDSWASCQCHLSLKHPSTLISLHQKSPQTSWKLETAVTTSIRQNREGNWNFPQNGLIHLLESRFLFPTMWKWHLMLCKRQWDNASLSGNVFSCTTCKNYSTQT